VIKQRWFINGILFIFISILGLFVFFTPNSQTPIELPPLTNVQPENVQQIRIERTDKISIELVKNNVNQWSIKNPLNLPANTFRVRQILNLLTTRDYQDMSAQALPLAEINLDIPLANVYIDSLAFAFGASSVFDSTQRYVQFAQKIYLIKDNIYAFLISDLLTFVSLSPLGENAKIVALQLPDYQLYLSAGGAWEVTTALENIDKRPDTVNRLIERWQTLQAIEVQNYVESTPEGEIHITLAEQTQPVTLQVITQHPDLILARPAQGVQYLFPISQTDELLHLPAKIAEKTPPEA
jgi:hypothetical protein